MMGRAQNGWISPDTGGSGSDGKGLRTDGWISGGKGKSGGRDKCGIKGKGGDNRIGGGGKGQGGETRTPGTHKFLKNHHKMLAHQLRKGEQELEEAVQGCRRAQIWLNDRETNVHYLRFKQHSLDNEGLYILDHEHMIVDLSAEEKDWNLAWQNVGDSA